MSRYDSNGLPLANEEEIRQQIPSKYGYADLLYAHLHISGAL